MEDWMDYKSFSDEISRIVRPQSYPLGIKLFKGKDILPKEAVRPSKYGVKISLCQWTTMARRWGRILAAETADISCTPCLAALGMKKMGNITDLVEYFLEMGYFGSKEAAEVAARELAPLSAGSISGIAFSPLHISPFEPDVIVIYGTPAQMARLAAGYVYHTGELIESQTTGFGISCLSAVKPFFTGKPAFVHPGRGERILAGTDEAEMFFTFPAKNCDRFLEGLRKTEANGTRYPVQSFLLYQPPILQPLKNLGDKLTEA
jgi:uncharacterized protein (DUF169 family)